MARVAANHVLAAIVFPGGDLGTAVRWNNYRLSLSVRFIRIRYFGNNIYNLIRYLEISCTSPISAATWQLTCQKVFEYLNHFMSDFDGVKGKVGVWFTELIQSNKT